MLEMVTVAIGHKFPFKCITEIADFNISPAPCSGAVRLIVVPDERLGANGQSLSEYSQLIWLAKNLKSLAPQATHVRIVHYRRFCSTIKPVSAFQSKHQPWASMLGDQEGRELLANQGGLPAEGYLFNTPASFGSNGVMTQYALFHELEDFLVFSAYLLSVGVLSKDQVVKFIGRSEIIPSCNIGIFPVHYFMEQMGKLSLAADFMFNHRYISRQGYQRRNTGYLLERLQSHLIIDDMEMQRVPVSFGSNIFLSDNPEAGMITGTDKLY